MDENNLPKLVNSDVVKKYYAWCTLSIKSIKVKVWQKFFGVFSFSKKKKTLYDLISLKNLVFVFS
jgi:hypothetical protein